MTLDRRAGAQDPEGRADGTGAARPPPGPWPASGAPSLPPCPGCGAPARAPVFTALQVPVRACTAPGASRELALASPRGDVRLAGCDACGLITNAAFDPGLLDAAGPGPIDSQAHAAGQREALAALARRLVLRFGVRGRTVVDVGCGDGRFLAALCAAGDNRGIGIDPAAGPAGDGLRMIREPYSDAHADLDADVLCCRFLLEHVADPAELLRLVARTLRRPGALAFFEVPDARLTLERGLAWEVFYEHVSYFTPGSLCRLFRAAGFDVLDLGVLTRDRHIALVARRGSGAPCASALEDDLREVRAAASSFAERAGARVEGWREELEALGQVRLALWGAGARASAFLAAVGERAARAVAQVVDVDPAKRGARLAGTGHLVVAPEDLCQAPPDAVLVMNELYLADVRRDLLRLGLGQQVVAA